MKKVMIVFISLVVILLLATLGLGAYIYKDILDKDTIYDGIKIDGYYASGKTMEEALEYIKERKTAEIDYRSINLIFEESIFILDLDQIEFVYDYDKAVKTAFSYGRQGNYITRLKDIDKVRNGIDVPLEFSYTLEKIEIFANNLSKQINKEPSDAVFYIDDGTIVLVDQVVGAKLNPDDLIREIEEKMFLLEDIQIPIEITLPNKTNEYFSKINGIIGEYSTSFGGSSKNRIENIRLSSTSISNKLILPGEELSFNDLTGPRSPQSGYQKANVIVAGGLIQGFGGGVCQTSSTMYNALLLSGVTITERHPHSLPVNYVPYGKDATVVYGHLDLKFRNDFDFPIYTYSKVEGNRLFIYIYGDTKTIDFYKKKKP